MQTIKYPSSQTIIKGVDLGAIIAGSVILELREDFSYPDFPDNIRLSYIDALRSNSHATLGFNIDFGALTKVVFKISFYRNGNYYQQTSSTFQGGQQILKPMTIVLNSTDFSNGRYQYEFSIPACDGIKIEIDSIEGGEGGQMTEIHLALRVN